MIISGDKSLWWDILKWDIADGVLNMERGLYTFTVCTGADLKNIGNFKVIYDDFLGELDEDGDIYRAIQTALDEAINEMRDELSRKIDRADTNPDDFGAWFNKELVVRGYKDRILKNVARVIEYNSYKYKRVDLDHEWCYRLWNWAKRWLSKNE